MEPRSKKARFGEVSEDAELQALDARTPMSTKTATTFWLGVFESFCVEKEIVLDLKSCSASELDEVLGKFYLGLRMKNGERNKKASNLAARAAISRYIAIDLSKPACNVFRQAEFQRSNNILDGVLKQAKASGEERAVEHKEAITADDLEKIQRYFDDVLDVGDPMKLTQFCWFHLSIHFALRSKEIQTTIRKSDIVFETDSEGKEYASLRRDFLAKNSPGGIKGREYESCGRLQEPRQVEAVTQEASYQTTSRRQASLPAWPQRKSARKQANVVYEGTPGPHRPRRYVATNKRSGSPFPKIHKSLSSSDKRRYLEGFRLQRPSCMPPDRAQKPAKPRKLLQVIRKREASSRTCARRKIVQVARRRGFFLFFESSGNDHFVQPTRQLRFQEQRRSQPHDQHQERRRHFLKKKTDFYQLATDFISQRRTFISQQRTFNEE